LNPGLLGSAVAFAGRLRALESERGIDYGPLRRLLQPYLLRRMKTDKRIISDLPAKIDVKERCSLTRRQAVIYSRLVEELRRVLNDDAVDGFQRRGQVLGFLTKFKQVCNHPSHYSGDGRYDAADSGKFARLAELAAEIGERQERLIVFTQYQEMCAPLAAHLEAVFGRGGLVLHGGTPVTDRQRLVERFQSPDGPPFFVVSVKAGGTGLTLTAANHVIHFDRWWNPAVENQATDRAYRIGQRRTVVVHKFVVAGTLEERVDQMLAEKQTVANELLETDESLPALTEMSAEQLLQLVALDIETIS
jgi:SNF2 family DNA or RNA helicase